MSCSERRTTTLAAELGRTARRTTTQLVVGIVLLLLAASSSTARADDKGNHVVDNASSNVNALQRDAANARTEVNLADSKQKGAAKSPKDAGFLLQRQQQQHADDTHTQDRTTHPSLTKPSADSLLFKHRFEHHDPRSGKMVYYQYSARRHKHVIVLDEEESVQKILCAAGGGVVADHERNLLDNTVRDDNAANDTMRSENAVDDLMNVTLVIAADDVAASADGKRNDEQRGAKALLPPSLRELREGSIIVSNRMLWCGYDGSSGRERKSTNHQALSPHSAGGTQLIHRVVRDPNVVFKSSSTDDAKNHSVIIGFLAVPASMHDCFEDAELEYFKGHPDAFRQSRKSRKQSLVEKGELKEHHTASPHANGFADTEQVIQSAIENGRRWLQTQHEGRRRARLSERDGVSKGTPATYSSESFEKSNVTRRLHAGCAYLKDMSDGKEFPKVEITAANGYCDPKWDDGATGHLGKLRDHSFKDCMVKPDDERDGDMLGLLGGSTYTLTWQEKTTDTERNRYIAHELEIWELDPLDVTGHDECWSHTIVNKVTSLGDGRKTLTFTLPHTSDEGFNRKCLGGRMEMKSYPEFQLRLQDRVEGRVSGSSECHYYSSRQFRYIDAADTEKDFSQGTDHTFRISESETLNVKCQDCGVEGSAQTHIYLKTSDYNPFQETWAWGYIDIAGTGKFSTTVTYEYEYEWARETVVNRLCLPMLCDEREIAGVKIELGILFRLDYSAALRFTAAATVSMNDGPRTKAYAAFSLHTQDANILRNETEMKVEDLESLSKLLNYNSYSLDHLSFQSSLAMRLHPMFYCGIFSTGRFESSAFIMVEPTLNYELSVKNVIIGENLQPLPSSTFEYSSPQCKSAEVDDSVATIRTRFALTLYGSLWTQSKFFVTASLFGLGRSLGLPDNIRRERVEYRTSHNLAQYCFGQSAPPPPPLRGPSHCGNGESATWPSRAIVATKTVEGGFVYSCCSGAPVDNYDFKLDGGSQRTDQIRVSIVPYGTTEPCDLGESDRETLEGENEPPPQQQPSCDISLKYNNSVDEVLRHNASIVCNGPACVDGESNRCEAKGTFASSADVCVAIECRNDLAWCSFESLRVIFSRKDGTIPEAPSPPQLPPVSATPKDSPSPSPTLDSTTTRAATDSQTAIPALKTSVLLQGITKDAFDIQSQSKFKKAIANVVGTLEENIEILSVRDVSLPVSSSGRKSLELVPRSNDTTTTTTRIITQGISVHFEVKGFVDQASAHRAASSLQTQVKDGSLSANLQSQGFPLVTITLTTEINVYIMYSPATVPPPSEDGGGGNIAAVAIGITAGLAILVVGVLSVMLVRRDRAKLLETRRITDSSRMTKTKDEEGSEFSTTVAMSGAATTAIAIGMPIQPNSAIAKNLPIATVVKPCLVDDDQQSATTAHAIKLEIEEDGESDSIVISSSHFVAGSLRTQSHDKEDTRM